MEDEERPRALFPLRLLGEYTKKQSARLAMGTSTKRSCNDSNPSGDQFCPKQKPNFTGAIMRKSPFSFAIEGIFKVY